MGRKKELRQTFFGQERYFGTLDTCVHTDVLSLVRFLSRCAKARHLSSRTERRQLARQQKSLKSSTSPQESEMSKRCGTKRTLDDIAAEYTAVKRVKLSDERITQVEQCMRESASCPYQSLRDLESAVFEWADEFFSNFDADNYYDEKRTAQYTSANSEIQHRLTNRVLDLLQPSNPHVLLDLACGSGLSTQAASTRFTDADRKVFLIGCDVSSAMVMRAYEEHTRGNGYVDFVLADMKQPSPFRRGAFDAAFSVSAIHYLAEEKDKLICFSGLAECTTKFSAQFFPAQEDVEVIRMRDAAIASGWTRADLLLDQTHHTNSYRWYINLGNIDTQTLTRTCKLYRKPHSTCVLCVEGSMDPSHLAFVRAEHVKYARKLLRSMRRDPALLSEEEASLALEIAQALGLVSSEGDFSAQIPSLEELKMRYDSDLHVVLHK